MNSAGELRAWLEEIAATNNVSIDSEKYARLLDERDPLSVLRNEFHIPQHDGANVIYLLGNSLGLQPKNVKGLLEEELRIWAERACEGHFKHEFHRPWLTADEHCVELIHPLVGAKRGEVAVMGSLSANLHLLLCAFYHPTSERYKIIIESKTFPSDFYIVESQIRFHGLDPKDALVVVDSPSGEIPPQTEDVLAAIKMHGKEASLILIPGVQYYTGYLYDLEKITRLGHEMGCYVGFDLAHAVGNVPLNLHKHGVDFAAWCSYKYLNAGPGAIAGLFVHNRHADSSDLTVLRGWWGHDKTTRFNMDNNFVPIAGSAGSFQLSNPDILSLTSLLGSLQIFNRTQIEQIRAKSAKLSAYMRILLYRLTEGSNPRVHILTPEDPHQAGAQLSLLVRDGNVGQILQRCEERGLIFDKREPNVIRLATTGLYNTFLEVQRGAKILTETILQVISIK